VAGSNRFGAVALATAARLARVPPVPPLPVGRMLHLPGRGNTFLVDTGEPAAGADPHGVGPGAAQHAEKGAAGRPTLILLHALACTGLLTWYPCLDALRRRHRVVIFDQRSHGQGIRGARFDLDDCADDVAAVADALGIDRFVLAGYSMGTLVAQLTWLRHPDRVAGLVLCAGATHFADTPRRQDTVHRVGQRLAAVAARHGQLAARALDQTVDHRWAWRQFRATTGADVAGAGTVLARFDSRPWIGKVNVPTAVVVTARDRLIPSVRQHRMARAIPHATVYEVAAGHASCVLGAERFKPAMLAAVASVSSRIALPPASATTSMPSAPR
jgi:3-oxoadipate enol-lactonase